MAVAGLWTRLTSGIAGFAIGAAAADAITPVLEPARQSAWAKRAFKVLDPGTAAEVVAEQYETPVDLPDDAARNGIGPARFELMTELARRAPDVPLALELWRHGTIGEAEVEHALRKAKLPREWWPGLKELRLVRLEPATVATSVQRGIMDNPGLLPVGPPAGVGKVPPMPQVAVDPIKEAAASGLNFDRIAAMARIVGLPPAPGELLELVNRGAIEEVDYYRGVAEGNTRNEWAPFLLELRHQLTSPAEAAGLRLRGWIDAKESYALGRLHGASPEVMDRLFLNRGRPATAKQVFIGLRRGGVYDGPTAGIDPAIVRAVRQSDIRPEWTNLLAHQLETYPTAFVLRALTEAGNVTQADAEQVLLFEGWNAELAHKVALAWSHAGAGGASKQETAATLRAEYEGYFLSEAELRAGLAALGFEPAAVDREVHLGDAGRIKAYRDKALEATHKSYTGAQITPDQASATLTSLHVSPAAIAELLAVWDIERGVTRKTLTAAQIRAAYRRGTLTQEQALADLEDHGYSAADALVYLSS